MKTLIKIMATALALTLIAVISVTTTLAYLTDDASTTNTFTIGRVRISLTETVTDELGVLSEDTAAESGKTSAEVGTLVLIPGETYYRKPVLTVKAGSEEAYVRMLVSVNNTNILSKTFSNIGNGTENDQLLKIFNLNSNGWVYYGCKLPTETTQDEFPNTILYEFRYALKVDAKNGDVEVPSLFDSYKIPGEKVDTATLKALAESEDKFQIKTYAQAIQAGGFTDATEAFAALDEQIGTPEIGKGEAVIDSDDIASVTEPTTSTN